MPRARSDIPPDAELVTLFRQHRSYAKVGDLSGVNPHTVKYRIMRHVGCKRALAIKEGRDSDKPSRREFDYREIAGRKGPLKEVAAFFGCSRSTVIRSRLHARHGVKKHKRGIEPAGRLPRLVRILAQIANAEEYTLARLGDQAGVHVGTLQGWLYRRRPPGLLSFEAALNAMGYKLKIVEIGDDDEKQTQAPPQR
jgi:hypothetical protein